MLFSSWLWVVGPIVSDAASVTFYGVDTKHDKIIFGVEASEDIEKAKQAIHKAHFPLGQFTFQVTGPIEVDSGA